MAVTEAFKEAIWLHGLIEDLGLSPHGMILSTLGLSPHGFALGLYPKGLIPMEIFVHPYIPMILPISSQCGTLVVYPTLFIYQSFYYTHILFNISCSIFFIYIFYLLSFYYQLIKYYL